MSKPENAELLNRDDQFDNELSLIDLVVFVRKNLRALLGGALTGGILGLALAFILPAQWEANALIRIGQLGNAGNAGRPVEPLLQVVDRIKNKSFQIDVLKSLDTVSSVENIKATNFNDALKSKLEKSELISLALRGSSPNEVKRNMNAVITQLKKTHIKMAAPIIDRWHQELASIDLELNQSKAEAERFKKIMDGRPGSLSEKSFSQAVLLSNILIAREGELRSLRDHKHILEEQLSPEQTFDTDILGQVEVSTKPVFPKKSLFAVAGLFIGLLLGILFSMLRSIGSRMGASIKSI
jgi:uncharacterized protein involved in exopolysaccharide biosynthesis